MGNENIQKSVRLPVELVEYIEKQKGRNFSEKLIGLLDEYFGGEELRQENIRRYEDYISDCRDILKKQRVLTCNTQTLMQNYFKVISDAITECETITRSRDRPPSPSVPENISQVPR